MTMRPIAVADLDEQVRLDGDPEVMRHITAGVPTPRAVMEDHLLPRMLASATEPGLGFFALEDGAGSFLGSAFLLRIESSRNTLARRGRVVRIRVGGGRASAGIHRYAEHCPTEHDAEMRRHRPSRYVVPSAPGLLYLIGTCPDLPPGLQSTEQQ